MKMTGSSRILFAKYIYRDFHNFTKWIRMFLLNMIRNSNIYGMKICSVSKSLSLYTEDNCQYIHSTRCLLWCAKTARLRSTLFLSSPLRRKKRTWESAVILRTWKYSCYLSIPERGAVQQNFILWLGQTYLDTLKQVGPIFSSHFVKQFLVNFC